jgi:hypothetical protein
VKETQAQTSKKEGKEESKNPNITGNMRGVWQRKFRSIWGERVQEKEKWLRNLNVGTRREKTGIGWEERKEGAEYAMRRERQWSTCGMDVAKWERGRERNGEKYWMETRWMKEIWKRRERIEKERGGDSKKKKLIFGIVLLSV